MNKQVSLSLVMQEGEEGAALKVAEAIDSVCQETNSDILSLKF